jgi:hypothetical protein
MKIHDFSSDQGALRFCELLTSENPAWIGRSGGTDTYFVEAWNGFDWDYKIKEIRKYTGYYDHSGNVENLKRFVQMYIDSSKAMDLCTVHLSSQFGNALNGDNSKGCIDTLENKYGISEIMCWRFLENAIPFMESFKHWSKGKRILVVSPFSRSIEYQTHPDRVGNLHKEDFGFSNCTFSTVNTPITYNTDTWECDVDAPNTNWFESAEAIFQNVSSREFDVALLACGSYAMYLGEKIKTKLGKKAVYVGGILSVYFNLYNDRYSSTGHDLSVINPDSQIISLENENFSEKAKEGNFKKFEGLNAYFGSKESKE